MTVKDDDPTKAAFAAYADAMRRCQTWRHAVRAALAAARALDPNVLPMEMLPEGWEFYEIERWLDDDHTWFVRIVKPKDRPLESRTGRGPTPRAAFEAACAAARNP